MSEQAMAATRDELADDALKHYDELARAAWPNGSWLSTIPQAIEAWRKAPKMEKALNLMLASPKDRWEMACNELRDALAGGEEA